MDMLVKQVYFYRSRGIRAFPIEGIEIKLSTSKALSTKFGKANVGEAKYISFLRSLGIDPDKNVLCLYISNDSYAYRKICEIILKEDIWSWIVKKGLHRRVIEDLLNTTIYDNFTEVIIERRNLN